MWALGWFWLGPAEGCEPPAEAAAVVTEHVVVASSPLSAEVEENFCHLPAAPGLWVLGFGVYFKIHNLTLNLKPKSKPGRAGSMALDNRTCVPLNPKLKR